MSGREGAAGLLLAEQAVRTRAGVAGLQLWLPSPKVVHEIDLKSVDLKPHAGRRLCMGRQIAGLCLMSTMEPFSDGVAKYMS